MTNGTEKADAGYPRDLIGYGADPPVVRWPGSARIAVQFVINGIAAAFPLFAGG